MEYIKKNWLKIVIGLVVVFIVIKVLQYVASMIGNNSDDYTAPPRNAGTTVPKFLCDETKADRNKKMYVGLKKSSEVCYLQIWLNTYFRAGLKVDGDFGSKTLDALKKAKGQTGGSLNDLGI